MLDLNESWLNSSGNESLAKSFGPRDGIDLALGLGTILANLVVLYIAFRHVPLRTRLSQIFVASMTMADLVFGLTYVLTKPVIEELAEWMCGPYYVLTWGCGLASVLFLLFLNADKFLALYYPLHYPSIVTERRVLVQTGLSWLVILLYTTLSYYWGFEGLIKTQENFISCSTIIKTQPMYYAVYTLLGFVVPILLSLCISVYIFYVATTIGSSEPQLSAHRRQRKRQLLFTRILFVFSSTLWTSLTVLPYRFAFASYNFCAATAGPLAVYGEEKESGEIPPDPCAPAYFVTFMEVIIQILPVGGLVNPLITILTQRVYRRRVFLWTARLLCLCRVEVETGSLRPGFEDDERTVDYTNSTRRSLHDSRRTASSFPVLEGSPREHRPSPAHEPNSQPSDSLLPHNSSQTCFQVV